MENAKKLIADRLASLTQYLEMIKHRTDPEAIRNRGAFMEMRNWWGALNEIVSRTYSINPETLEFDATYQEKVAWRSQYETVMEETLRAYLQNAIAQKNSMEVALLSAKKGRIAKVVLEDNQMQSVSVQQYQIDIDNYQNALDRCTSEHELCVNADAELTKWADTLTNGIKVSEGQDGE